MASSDPAVLGALARADAEVVIDLNGRLGDDVEHILATRG